MDFIESIFHISPGNGNGLTEITLFLTLVAAPLLVAALRKKLKRSQF
ncbi:MAG: hypothetical protein WAN65_22765 [Candidatus Sulfotelmatobacter sp.]